MDGDVSVGKVRPRLKLETSTWWNHDKCRWPYLIQWQTLTFHMFWWNWWKYRYKYPECCHEVSGGDIMLLVWLEVTHARLVLTFRSHVASLGLKCALLAHVAGKRRVGAFVHLLGVRPLLPLPSVRLHRAPQKPRSAGESVNARPASISGWSDVFMHLIYIFGHF